MCDLTVASVKNRREAISRFDSPAAIRRSTSTSRGVRPSGAVPVGVPEAGADAAEPPEAPNTYATSGALSTRSTASRAQVFAPDGSWTAAKELPALVEENRPESKVASSSVAPPLGCTLIAQQRPDFFELQLLPLLVDL